MNLKTNTPTTDSAKVKTFDTVVIGAGFAGLYALHRLRDQMRRSARVFDIAGDVGEHGTGTATPIGNVPMDPEIERQTKAHYAEIRTKSRNSFLGVPYDQVLPSAIAVSPEERRRVYDECYTQGGFRLIFDSFQDLLFNKESNDTAAEYIRAKIRERVKDPKVAEMLTPKDYPYGTIASAVGNKILRNLQPG